MSYTRRRRLGSLGGVSGSWGQILTKNLPPYQITDADVLWAARAGQFEGHDAADTLWTWTQRYGLPNIRNRFSSLADLILAHSQPVNPIWRRDGSKCRPGAQYHGTDHCSETRLARRDQAARLSWDQIRPDVRDKTLRWAKAQLPNPVPRSTDFAAPNVTQSYISRNPSSQMVKQAGNWFITAFGSENWPADQVVITHEGRTAGPALLTSTGARVAVGVGAVAIAAAAAFAAWGYSRR